MVPAFKFQRSLASIPKHPCLLEYVLHEYKPLNFSALSGEQTPPLLIGEVALGLSTKHAWIGWIVFGIFCDALLNLNECTRTRHVGDAKWASIMWMKLCHLQPTRFGYPLCLLINVITYRTSRFTIRTIVELNSIEEKYCNILDAFSLFHHNIDTRIICLTRSHRLCLRCARRLWRTIAFTARRFRTRLETGVLFATPSWTKASFELFKLRLFIECMRRSKVHVTDTSCSGLLIVPYYRLWRTMAFAARFSITRLERSEPIALFNFRLFTGCMHACIQWRDVSLHLDSTHAANQGLHQWYIVWRCPIEPYPAL